MDLNKARNRAWFMLVPASGMFASLIGASVTGFHDGAWVLPYLFFSILLGAATITLVTYDNVHRSDSERAPSPGEFLEPENAN